MTTTPALLRGAAGVGFGHAILPDHWVPLAVVGRTQRYPLTKVARLSSLAGVTHVLVSIAARGGDRDHRTSVRVRPVEHAQNAIVGALLIATGLLFAVLELTGHGHDHDHDHHAPRRTRTRPRHRHDHDRVTVRRPRPVPSRAVAAFDHGPVRCGGLPGPDDPAVFLAATTAGVGVAMASVVVFAAVTIGTFVGLTLFATAGGYQMRAYGSSAGGTCLTAGVITATVPHTDRVARARGAAVGDQEAAGRRRTGIVLSWFRNADSTISGLPASSIAG